MVADAVERGRAATPGSAPEVVSVNVGPVRTVLWRGREVTTGIWKSPVVGPVAVQGVNVADDDQVDRHLHGGVDKAVYAYASEDYSWWARRVGALGPGTFGENLTTVGLDLRGCRIGDRWAVGSTVLEVAQPRTPCFKLGIRMGDDTFPRRFAEAGRPGAYLRIVTPGVVASGDRIDVTPGVPPGVAITSLSTGRIGEEELAQLLTDPRVPEVWKRAAPRASRGTGRPTW